MIRTCKLLLLLLLFLLIHLDGSQLTRSHSHSFAPILSLTLALTMTTFIPSVTLPSELLLSKAASIALPVAMGSFVGFADLREFSLLY